MRYIRICLFVFLLVFCIESCKRKGCTDPTAVNYNEKAKKNDGSCIDPTCSDGIQNGDETGVDCGGSCLGVLNDQYGNLLRLSQLCGPWKMIGSMWGNQANDLFFFDNNVGIALTYRISYGSKFYKTTDGGNTWDEMQGNPADLANSVHFPSSSVGYIVGDNTLLLKTIDGGDTWNVLPLNVTVGSVPGDAKFNDVFFLDNEKGFICDDWGFGTFLRTIDGGASWEVIPTISTPHKVVFANNSIGFVISESSLFRTSDGGDNWSYSTSFNNLIDITFPNATTGYLTERSNNGVIVHKTTDSGNNWSALPALPVDLEVIYDRTGQIVFTDASTGYITGHNGLIGIDDSKIIYVVYTTDGGATWTYDRIPHDNHCQNIPSNTTALVFPTSSTGFLLTEDGDLYKYPN